MSIWHRSGDAWRYAQPYVRANGDWRQANGCWIMRSGVWRQMWEISAHSVRLAQVPNSPGPTYTTTASGGSGAVGAHKGQPFTSLQVTAGGSISLITSNQSLPSDFIRSMTIGNPYDTNSFVYTAANLISYGNGVWTWHAVAYPTPGFNDVLGIIG